MPYAAFLPCLPRSGLPRPARQTSRSPRRRARPVAKIVLPYTAPTPADLAAFAAAVRGEWTGYEGVFCSTTGRPQPVADYYIPEQFVEWGLTPHGFESNHSIIVRDTTLFRKFFRVLPTVSLFADHVDTEEDFRAVEVGGAGAHIFPDGCFVTGPLEVTPRRESKLSKWPRVEFCLRDPTPDVKRAVHLNLSFDFEGRRPVGDVRAVLEKWSCVYCDGADMDGSSGYVEGWVVNPPTPPDQLRGDWHVHAGDGDGDSDEGCDGAPARVTRDAHDALALPEGITVRVAPHEGGVCAEAGWLVGDARVLLRRVYDADGATKFSERVLETRV